jgi:hypothetical protein
MDRCCFFSPARDFSWRDCASAPGGTGTRELLLQPDLGRDGAPPNIPALWNSSAREIAARFNLH